MKDDFVTRFCQFSESFVKEVRSDNYAKDPQNAVSPTFAILVFKLDHSTYVRHYVIARKINGYFTLSWSLHTSVRFMRKCFSKVGNTAYRNPHLQACGIIVCACGKFEGGPRSSRLKKPRCQRTIMVHIKRTHLNGGKDPSVLNSLLIIEVAAAFANAASYLRRKRLILLPASSVLRLLQQLIRRSRCRRRRTLENWFRTVECHSVLLMIRGQPLSKAASGSLNKLLVIALEGVSSVPRVRH